MAQTPAAVTATSRKRAAGRLGFTPGEATKQAVNQWLVELAAGSDASTAPNAAAKTDGWVMALESEALTSLRAFTQGPLAVVPGTFVCPNPSAEVGRAVTEAGGVWLQATSHRVLAELRAGAGPHHTELSRLGWSGTFEVVWLDYCGTLDSRAGKQRKADISAVLADAGLLSSGGVLAVTVSERGGSQLYAHATVDELIEHVTTASQAGRLEPHFSGLACYPSVGPRREGSKQKMADARPLHLYTVAWRCVSGKPPELGRAAACPPVVPGLDFHSEWHLYGGVAAGCIGGTGLLSAARVCTDAFSDAVLDAAARCRGPDPTEVVTVLVLDSRLAPAACAVLGAVAARGSGAVAVEVALDREADVPVARAAVAGLLRGCGDGGHDVALGWHAGGLRSMLDALVGGGADVDPDPGGPAVAGRPPPRCAGVWIDLERQRTFNAADLAGAGAGWKDLDRLFRSGVLGAGVERAPQVLGLLLKVAASKEIWQDAAVDLVVAAVVEVAHRHTGPDGTPRVVVCGVATFSFPPAPRVAVIFQLGGTGPTSAARPVTALTWRDSPPPHSSWKSWVGWHLDRPKVPTVAAVKFGRISAHLAKLVVSFGLRRPAVHEPGFHHVLPALLRLGGALEGVLACCALSNDPVQRREVERRYCDSDVPVRWAGFGEVGQCPSVDHDAIFALTETSATSWTRQWLPIVQVWLGLRARRTDPAAAWSVVAVLVENSKPPATATLHSAITEAAEAIGAAVSSDVEHSIFSTSTKYSYRSFGFRFAPAGRPPPVDPAPAWPRLY